IQILNKLSKPPFVDEMVFFARAFVRQMNLDAGVEERQFSKTLRENVVVELDVLEGRSRGFEIAFGAALLGLAHDLERLFANAVLIRLLVHLLIAAHRQQKRLRERVDD